MAYKKLARALGLLLTGSVVQCQGSSSGDDGNQCIPGEHHCVCNEGQCLQGLTCVDEICVDIGGSETDGNTGSESSTSTEETETETGSPCGNGETLCDGQCVNLSSDDNNCGECGKICTTALDTGGCDAGACAPVWSYCVSIEDQELCSVVCEAQGFPGCATNACGPSQTSAVWYGLFSNCQAGEIPVEVESNACQFEPDGQNGSYYRCCCTQQ